MKAHLREWRLYLDKTQVDLARHIGVTKGEISRLESGYRRMTMEWIGKLAGALGIKPEQLLQLPPNYSSAQPQTPKPGKPGSGFPLVVTTNDMELVGVTGDEMSPTVTPGDCVVVDTTRRAPAPPGLFVCEDGGERMLRRLQTIGGGRLRVSFDNPAYPAYEADPADIEIVGRVVMRIHRL